MASSPKRILLQLDSFDASLLPGWVLKHYSISKDGIVSVAMPRFPRVSDVKLAAEQALGIPAKDQVLRGPLPSLSELSCNWAHLWEFEIFPGLDNSKTAPKDVSEGVSTPGELFSTVPPLKSRIHDGGAVVSDVLQLSTAHPVNEYLPGGSIYQKHSRRRFIRSALWNTLLVLLVLAAIFYVLWQVPGYEMPQPRRKKPSYWDNLTEEELQERRRLLSNPPAGDELASNMRRQAMRDSTATLRNEL
mmetsp:Transcript_4701/g.13046  ORF Transcript_4701/g.13046 Transcript_4701/m.13046 type:complete len:246 (+) Transcript_4701:26-763(+)